MRIRHLSFVLAVLLSAACDGRAPAAEAATDRHGDPLPPGAIARLGTQRLHHPAWGLAFAVDGKTFATAGHDGLVRLLNVANGKEIRQFKAGGRTLACNGVAFAADGKTLLSCGIDGLIREWNLTTGAQIRALPGKQDQPIYALAPHPNEPLLLALESGGSVHEWNLKEGKETRKVAHRRGTPVALCPDGKHFAVFKDNALSLRDMADKEVQRFPTGNLPVMRLAFAADGRTLAAGCADKVVVWDVKTNKEIRTVSGAPNSYFLAALSPDGRSLAVKAGAAGPVQVFDVASGKELHKFTLPLDVAYVLTFATSGKTLACSGGARVHLWNLDTGRPLFEFGGHPGTIDDVRFAPDGKRLTTTSRYGVVFWWDTATRRPLASWKSPSSASFRFLPGPDGQSIFYGTFKGLKRCDCNDGQPAERPLGKETGAVNTCVALSADSKLLAVRGSDNVTRIVAVDGGNEVGRLPVEPFVYYRAVFSSDGKYLASGGAAPQVSVWDTRSGAMVRQFVVANKNNPRLTSGVSAFLYSPDGRGILTLNAEAALWEAATGRERWRAARPLGQLSCGAFSPDGRLAALGSQNGTIHVVETATGAELGKFAAGSRLNSLDFSADGRRLASGGDDGLALIWDTAELSKKSMLAGAELKPEQLAVLWRDLDSPEAAKAHAAGRALAASPRQSVPFLRARLQAGETPDTRRIQRLIMQLDAEDFEEREKAHKELAAMNSVAVPLLRQALRGKPSAEVQDRVMRLLEPYRDQGAATELLRLGRALEALEHSGTLDAVKVVKMLADADPQAPLTQQAKAALARLARRTAAEKND